MSLLDKSMEELGTMLSDGELNLSNLKNELSIIDEKFQALRLKQINLDKERVELEWEYQKRARELADKKTQLRIVEQAFWESRRGQN